MEGFEKRWFDYCAFHVLVQPNFCRATLDIIFNSCLIKLKFSSIISTFYTLSDAKFQLDSTTDEEFPHRPPIVKIARFREQMNGGLWGNSLPVVAFE